MYAVDRKGDWALTWVRHEQPHDVEAWLRTRIDQADADLLVLDDADTYLVKTPQPGSAFAELYFEHRKLGADVLVTARRPQSLSPSLLSAVRFLWAFRVGRLDVSGLDRIRDVAGPLVDQLDEEHRFLRVDLWSGVGQWGNVEPDAFELVGEPFDALTGELLDDEDSAENDEEELADRRPG